MSLISVSEYSIKYNKDPGNIRRMLACGRLKGFKIGNQWVIDSETAYPKDNRIVNGDYINWRKNSVLSLKKLQQIISNIVYKYKAEGAILFGSYARNEATAHSDIDLYVIGGSNFDPTDIFCIADELFSITKKKVDVYEAREISKESALYNAIIREGIKIASQISESN